MRSAILLLLPVLTWGQTPKFCWAEAPLKLDVLTIRGAREALREVPAWTCESAWVVLRPAVKIGTGRIYPEFARDLKVVPWMKQIEERGDALIVAMKRGNREYIRVFDRGRTDSTGEESLVKWNAEMGLLWISGMTRATDSQLTHPELEMRIDRKGVDLAKVPFDDVCREIRKQLGVESARVRLVEPGGLNRYLNFEPLLMMLREPWRDRNALHIQPDLRDCDCHHGVGKCRNTDLILPQVRP